MIIWCTHSENIAQWGKVQLLQIISWLHMTLFSALIGCMKSSDVSLQVTILCWLERFVGMDTQMKTCNVALQVAVSAQEFSADWTVIVVCSGWRRKVHRAHQLVTLAQDNSCIALFFPKFHVHGAPSLSLWAGKCWVEKVWCTYTRRAPLVCFDMIARW